jgi:hypothetical protein
MTTYTNAELFSQPVLQRHPAKRLWRLTEDYVFEWGDPGFRKMLICPAGFEYDKASVPRTLWGIARPDGPWEAAALFHDRLYMFNFKLPSGEFQTFVENEGWCPDASPWNRKQADELLAYMGYLGLRAEGYSDWAAKTESQRYRRAVHWWPGNWPKGFYL